MNESEALKIVEEYADDLIPGKTLRVPSEGLVIICSEDQVLIFPPGSGPVRVPWKGPPDGRGKEMVERVRAAMIAELKKADVYIKESDDSTVMIDGWTNLHAVARAAIMVMREPNKEMMDLAKSLINSGEARCPDHIWRTMIYAAIRGPSK